jgi:hypothetical protein
VAEAKQSAAKKKARSPERIFYFDETAGLKERENCSQKDSRNL